LTTFNATFGGVIQFVPYTTQPDYVNFNFDPNNLSGQCESYVGRIGGEQEVGGSVKCDLGTLLHEMGHVVGLYHEMSRPDRDNYITINTGNVIKGSEANFAILGDNFQDLTLFDYASVMEYIPYAFTRNGGAVIESARHRALQPDRVQRRRYRRHRAALWRRAENRDYHQQSARPCRGGGRRDRDHAAKFRLEIALHAHA
jgi:hypothetical protein